MAQAKGGTGCQEPFARRKGFDEDASGRGSRNLVEFVVCALVGCVYSLPVEDATLRYVSFGAGIGALVGIALSGAGAFFDRLLALDATAVGTVAVAVASLFVWLWYLASFARRGGRSGSPTWVVWLFSGGYVALIMILFFVLAAPIFG